MSGFYAADGSMNVTVVSGSTYTGLYAADGSVNVIKASGGSYVGSQHPCGAWWVSVSTDSGSPNPVRASDGSLNVYNSLGQNLNIKGGQAVTVVSGSLFGTAFLLLANGTDFLLLANATDKLILASH